MNYNFRSFIACIGLLILTATTASANDDQTYISTKKLKGAFSLATNGKPAPIVRGSSEDPGVIRAVSDLQSDLQRVTKAKPTVGIDKPVSEKEIVLIGTIGKNPLIDQLIRQSKIDVSAIRGKWEASLTQVVDKPMPGVDKALIIVGSDRRGTIYGIYDLSAQIGVSPWYWWADVPVKEQKNLYVHAGVITRAPAVKYRGIFINDEAPALSGWSREKFGGFNSKFYEHVFELILRLKGNYLWPAMWGSAFYDDDPKNPVLANQMGVVIGTSHHEPLMRAHDEWRRFGKGAWNYNTNDEVLRDFWRESIKRMGNNESIVTIGMRGDGDEPMSEGSNIALLEKIVKDQREIIAEVTGKPASETPQIWALYKEVQDYYDKGMRVPDDVTLLLADDNWGNIRKLPKLDEKPRSGGYGIYYHFDYVGGPRNYKWINTNPITKVWEQMHLARRYGADRLWLVNVGDIKPMEFPTEFFLDYAWNPEKWTADRLQEYTELWAAKQFPGKYAMEIADLISKYTKYNGRRKPELLDADTYSLSNYREFERVVQDFNDLLVRAEKVNSQLPAQYRDAYFQLVLHPVKASANLNELYYTVALNRLYAKQGRVLTNTMAAKARELFARDKEISNHYNKVIAGGKWNHMMDQTHIGYTYWQQPEKDVMPEVKEVTLPPTAGIGLATEGSDDWWPLAKQEAVLPEFSPYLPQQHYIEIFSRGTTATQFTVQSGAPWLTLSSRGGTVADQQRIWVSVDWKKAPTGMHKIPVTVTSGNSNIIAYASINNPASPRPAKLSGFAEVDGYVSIEPANYSRAVNKDSISWVVLPDYGRVASAVTTFPVTAPAQLPNEGSAHLQYDVYLQEPGEIKLHAYISPTIDFANSGGLRYAVSVDDEKPQLVNLHADNSERAWEKSVADNIKMLTTKHTIKSAGKHVVKFWRVDQAVVLQKIVIDAGGLKPSYLGPPETRVKK
ncbi:glycosyl hydrolase 115 family protein [Pedobacter sp. SYSU D00535]|uniref:glycosyl hydrolase 115 family protein n=1 Tax=Pedobacter sp. SYSU D00535 TaxID=2810308 RepID=UPI001A95F0DC|nr:glycosyl hydrolase 115 family protein [Pedobacter sp. SYSU D00535]